LRLVDFCLSARDLRDKWLAQAERLARQQTRRVGFDSKVMSEVKLLIDMSQESGAMIINQTSRAYLKLAARRAARWRSSAYRVFSPTTATAPHLDSTIFDRGSELYRPAHVRFARAP
jgi:hypothetical protein